MEKGKQKILRVASSVEKDVLEEAEIVFLKMDPHQEEAVFDERFAVVKIDSPSYLRHLGGGHSLFFGRKRASNGDVFAVFIIR